MTTSKEENPRQKMLEVIARKGPITIKDLKTETGMSAGSIYHHLSRMTEYVTQDEQKRYLLSQKGRDLFSKHTILQLPKRAWYNSFILPAIRNKYASIITIIAVLQLYILIYPTSSQLLLLPVNHGSVVESIALGWILSVIAAEGLSIAAGAKPGRGMLALASGISIATVPVVAFSTFNDMGYSYLASIPLYALALFIASSTISNAKNLSYASSIPVALSVLMLSIIVFTASLAAIIVLPIAITVAIIVVARLGYFDMAAEALSRASR
ncbi:MAG: hypothetical protein ACE5J2_04830 [Nitrososphaerales archaeon]